ncbi:MAG: PaaI family thioesterase [Chloroflexota bacterium]
MDNLVKQPNSRMCFVCGIDNPIGLKQSFYQDGEGRVIATFTPGAEHQGYPGLLHGGIAAALLDEALGRVLIAHEVWMVTARMEIRYKQMIPLNQPLTIVGETVRETRRLLEARGELHLADGSVAVSATATYLPMPQEMLDSMTEALGDWQVFAET